MAPDVASALAELGDRGRYTGDDDFVFVGEGGLPLDGDARVAPGEAEYRVGLPTRLNQRVSRHLDAWNLAQDSQRVGLEWALDRHCRRLIHNDCEDTTSRE